MTIMITQRQRIINSVSLSVTEASGRYVVRTCKVEKLSYAITKRQTSATRTPLLLPIESDDKLYKSETVPTTKARANRDR